MMGIGRRILKSIAPKAFDDGLKRCNQRGLLLTATNPQAIFLDVGWGSGALTLKFAHKLGTNNLHGVEIILEFAREATRKGIKCKIFDLYQKWEFADNTFDVILSSQNIGHISYTRKYSEEALRVLKPGIYLNLN